MNLSDNNGSGVDRIEQEAAEWLSRIDDGLSGEEQDAYVEWLAEDERHRKAMSLMQWGWGELDRLAGLQTSQQAAVNPALLAPVSSSSGQPRWYRRKPGLFAGIGMAAAILLCVAGGVFFGSDRAGHLEFEPAYELMTRLVNRQLEDGSVVELNRGASIRTDFTREKRLVFLEGGEANFIVAKDPGRPFVVSVGGVEVRAVGTIFNVKYIGKTVDVIVTEGKVQVEHHAGWLVEQSPVQAPMPLLTAGQQATIQIESNRPVVTLQTLEKEDLEDKLKWQPRLLKFDAAPLSDIIRGFNRHNQIQVELGDPELGEIVLTSAFWSDNVEGFVRLMENNFGMQIIWVDRHRIRLVNDRGEGSSL